MTGEGQRQWLRTPSVRLDDTKQDSSGTYSLLLAVSVVVGTQVGIAQDLVGLTDFLKLGVSVGRWVLVGMESNRELSVCFLELDIGSCEPRMTGFE